MGTSYYCSFLGTRGLEIHDGIRASAGKMSAGLKLKAEPPHELLCNQEREGAWDEEHRDGNSSSRKNHFLGSKSQEEQEAKNPFSALEVLPLTPLRCGVREELILMSLGLSGTSRQCFWTEWPKREMPKIFGIGKKATPKRWLPNSTFAFSSCINPRLNSNEVTQKIRKIYSVFGSKSWFQALLRFLCLLQLILLTAVLISSLLLFSPEFVAVTCLSLYLSLSLSLYIYIYQYIDMIIYLSIYLYIYNWMNAGALETILRLNSCITFSFPTKIN